MLKGENEFDQFGNYISLSKNGNSIAIGASNANNYFGYVKVFNITGGTWIESIRIDGLFYMNHIGYSVSLNYDGTILAIGSRENEDNSHTVGHTKIYKNNSGVWSQIGDDIKILSNDPATAQRLQLNDDGTILIIGIIYGDINKVNVYKNINSVWSKLGNDLEYISNHGVSINSNGNTIAIGVGHAVKIFEFNEALGINNNLIVNNLIYPNPTKGNFTIKQDNLKSIEIINTKGQIIKNINNINSNKLNINLCTDKGLYLIKITTDKNTSIKKLIVN